MSRKRRTVADEPFLVVRSAASDLAAGQVIGHHAHDWHQLIHASAGVLVVWTEQGNWVVPSSWGVWVPAGTAHGIRSAGGSAFRTLYVRPGWRDDLPGDCTAVTVSPLLRELILRTVAIGMLDRRDPVEAALAMLALEEVRQSGVPPFRLPQPVSPATRHVAAMLEVQGQGVGMAEMARQAGLSVRALERRFVAETGMSLGRWRRHFALLAALEHLAAGASVKAVAATAGYATPSAFVAAFRTLFGTTPARYFVPG
jgi:AraC-like DNA-binding protein